MSWPTSPDDPQGQPTEPESGSPEQSASPPPIEPRPGQPVAPPPPTFPSEPTAPAGYPTPGSQPATEPQQPGVPSGGYPEAPPTTPQPGVPSGGYPAAPQPGYPSGGYPTAPGQPGVPSGGYPAPGQPSGGWGPPGAGGYPGYPGYPGQTVRSQPGRKVLVGLVAVLAVAAGAFAVVNLRSGGRSGAGSPQEATTNFFESLSDEDVVGMAQMIDPAERDALLPFVEDLEAQMSRLAVTSDIDLGDVDGLDLEVQNLQVAEQELAPGIAQVDITGGVVTWATEPDAVPIGDALRDIIETNTGEPISIDATSDQEQIVSDEPLFLIATETNGRWHLSLAFTIAEYARRDAEQPMPGEGAGVAPQGASSPEEAVRAFLDAVGALDVERMIALLPPDSMRALQLYAPLFLEDAQESMDEFRDDEGFALTSEGLEFDTSSVDGGTRVVPTAGTITMETYEGGVAFSIADGCIEMTGELGEDFSDEYGDTRVCAGDLGELDDELSPEERETLGELGNIFGEMEPGIVTVEVDGAWYVDPLRSVSDLTIQLFAGIAPEDLRDGGVLFRLFTGDVFDDDVIYDDEEESSSGGEVEEGDYSSGDPYLDGYDEGYFDGYDDGSLGEDYDDTAASSVPPEHEEAPEDYMDGYGDGYADGYTDGETD